MDTTKNLMDKITQYTRQLENKYYKRKTQTFIMHIKIIRATSKQMRAWTLTMHKLHRK